jgi:hypothetical protein
MPKFPLIPVTRKKTDLLTRVSDSLCSTAGAESPKRGALLEEQFSYQK